MSVKISTDQTFSNDIQSAKVVVKYYADWCGSCKLFAPKYKRLSDDERFTQFAFLEVNAEQNPEARKLAGVETLPYFAIFENGQLKAKTSTSKEDAFVDFLLNALTLTSLNT